MASRFKWDARLRTWGVVQLLALMRLGVAALAVMGLARLAHHRTDARSVSRRVARERWLARQIVGTAGRLKGGFVKAGQFAASRHDLLPASVHEALASLRSRVPPLAADRILETLEGELGGPVGAWFRDFDPEPIGAASIAQAHRARLTDGTAVVVKVQYPWLADSLPAALAVIRIGLRIAAWLAPGRFDPDRLYREFEAGLREELDFEREGRAAEAIARNLATDPGVVVPAVCWSHTRRGVLAVERYEVLSLEDPEALARRGVPVESVLGVVARAYAQQVFVDGYFHADPHPGNLFVIDEPTANERPRVLFVDFGLSKKLDDRLRDEMRAAMMALLRRDPDGFVAGMQRLGIIVPGHEPGVHAAVARMFEKLQGTGSPLGLAGAQVLSLKDEAKALLQETPGIQLPHDLLLYAKTMSYVFGLGAELAPDVDMMRLCTPHLLRFLAQKPGVAAPGADASGPSVRSPSDADEAPGDG